MKKILLLLILTFNLSFSQNDLKARLEYEQAEVAFNQNNYKEANARLNNAQEFIGKWVPNVSYLKIKCLDKLCNYADAQNEYTIALSQEIKRYMSFAEANRESVVMDKFKEVYEIEEKFKNAANQAKLTSDPDFINAEAANTDGKYMLALENYKKAVAKGNAEAMRKIGNYYENGIYVEKNTETATSWYNKAIEKGNVEALVDLGNTKVVSSPAIASMVSLLGGFSSPTRNVGNPAEAKRLFTLAAEKGSSNALVALGQLEYMNGNLAGAVSYYDAAAEKGNGSGYRKLGQTYAFAPQNETTLALGNKWLTKAAALGDADAFYYLGTIIENTVASKPKSTRPELMVQARDYYIKYLEITNSKGDKTPQVQYLLGMKYFAEGNFEEALKYYNLSADAGNVQALTWLSQMYKKGLGVEKNSALAKEYDEKAKAEQQKIGQMYLRK